ncbi:hypothetical protein IWQ62_000483 [Dispira parvispora]|uniref:Uncharacterized protein n=1 Tax=Dispira parvispora TaxID=1520584 RepID=A0A9W8E967_9FUNG|nr:hypothetical protein IWQ62_000483 [Dispira parvispora]
MLSNQRSQSPSSATPSSLETETPDPKLNTQGNTLHRYLLGSTLNTTFSPKDFRDFFPPKYQDHPDLQNLLLTYTEWRKEINEMVQQTLWQEFPASDSPTNIAQSDTVIGDQFTNPIQRQVLAHPDSLRVTGTTTAEYTLEEAIALLENAQREATDQIQTLEKTCQDHLTQLTRKVGQLSKIPYPTAGDASPLPGSEILEDINTTLDAVERKLA